MFSRITLTASLLLSVLLGQNKPAPKTPDFTDYPVSAIFHGAPAAPKLSTPGQRMFRTMIRQGAAKGANFAGHYAIAEWGCGTACVQIAVVDIQSGAVYEGPFGTLPKAYIAYGTNPEDIETGILYRPDSELFVARGCPSDQQPGTYYYRWAGSAFTLLRRIPLKPWEGCGA